MTNKQDYGTTKKRFVVGVICFVAGIVLAVGGHIHAQELDLANLLFYEVSDLRVYAFVGCTLAGFALLGVPFVMLRFVKRIFALIFALITHNSQLFEFATTSGSDTIIEMGKNENGCTTFGEEKSAFRVVLETVLGIVLLVVGGILLYAVGVAVGIFVLIAQLIWLLSNKNKQFEDDSL